MDDDIRLLESGLARPVWTPGSQIPSLAQTGFLQQSFQDHFPPLALEFVCSLQRLGEVDASRADPLIQILQMLNLFDQGQPVPGFPVIDIFNLFLETPPAVPSPAQTESARPSGADP